NPPKPLKIGWLSNLTQELPIEAEILNLCEEALKIFATCGHTIEAVDFPINTETIWSCWKTLRHWQVAGNLQALYEDPQKSIELKPEAIWEIEQGLKLTALDVFRASKQRSLIYQAFEKLYQTFDIL